MPLFVGLFLLLAYCTACALFGHWTSFAIALIAAAPGLAIYAHGCRRWKSWRWPIDA